VVKEYNPKNSVDRLFFNRWAVSRDNTKSDEMMDFNLELNQPMIYRNKKGCFFFLLKRNQDVIIERGVVDASAMFSGTEYEEHFLNKIYIMNKRLFKDDTYFLKDEYTKEIIESLKKIKEIDETMATKGTIANLEEGYKDVAINEDGNKLIPTENFKLSSLLMNLFYDEKMRFEFTKNVPEYSVEDNQADDILKRAKIEILSFSEVAQLPVKYQAICTDTSNGYQCGNIVNFCEVHKNSSIRCVDSKQNSVSKGHTIKNPDKTPVIKHVNMYAYTIKIIGKDDNEQEFFSLVKMDGRYQEVNLMRSATKKGEMFPIIVSCNPNYEAPRMSKPFLRKNRGEIIEDNKLPISFLEDIFQSTKEYFKTYHNFEMTDQNKIVAHYIILQLLCTLRYDFIFKSLYTGKSGCGKSIWSKTIVPLLTSKYSIMNGTDITRNRLLGGKPSEKKLSMLNNSYLPGHITTDDFIFLEEATNELKDYQEAKDNNKSHKALSANVFSMLKGLDVKFQQFDVSIQGSRKSSVRATVCLVGNIEQLETLKKNYVDKVKKEYKVFAQGTGLPFYNNNWSPYKQVEYYMEVMKNEALAKAHALVRSQMLPSNYMTHLPEAEQSRIAVMIYIDDEGDDKDFTEMGIKSEVQPNFTYHTTVIQEEVLACFTVDKMSPEFVKKVTSFMHNYYFNERNNIVLKKDDYNRHLRQYCNEIMALLIFMNNQFRGKPHDSFTRNDEDIIRYYMRVNYNILSAREARMIGKPLINDLPYDTEGNLKNETDRLKEEIKIEKMKKDREGKIVDLEETGVDVKIIPDENKPIDEVVEDDDIAHDYVVGWQDEEDKDGV
jgi:hypothetical protein